MLCALNADVKPWLAAAALQQELAGGNSASGWQLITYRSIPIACFPQVLVLEGRDRIGGRIWSAALPGAAPGSGRAVDLGAAWIHGIKDNPIHALAKQQGIAMTPMNYESVSLYNASGQKVGTAVV